MRTISEVHQDVLKLQEFLERQMPGAELSYAEIEKETGVEMTSTGKTRLRTALRRSRLESATKYSQGIKLASAEFSVPILGTRMTRVDKAVRRADRTQRRLQDQFLGQMNESDRQKVLFAGAVFGAIRLASRQGKAMYSEKPKIEDVTHIPLPKFLADRES